MPSWTLALALASVALYVTATVVLGQRLSIWHGAVQGVAPRLPMIAFLAVVLHGVLLFSGVVADDGLHLGFFDTASLVAWLAALLLFIGATRRPLDNLGLLVLPLAALLILPSVIWPETRHLTTERNLGTEIHVLVSVLAFALLTIAACQSLLLAYQEHRLSHKRPGGLMRILPPLKIQEELLFQLIALGFFLLTLSLATGFAFVADMLAQHLAHKTVLSVIAWLIFGVLLWGRWRHGWRGRTAVRLSLAGFIVLGLAYFGTKLVLEVVLERYWFAG
ncbi:MAG: inner membrane protein YpjD [Gammaproteobacteria bacterium]|nr:MAG: inner membrane protein YpjD [Gammaproteobacteria bacterium]